MPAVEFPETLAIPSAAGVDAALAVGPGLVGYIYRSESGPNWYRVLSRNEAPIQVRHFFASLRGRAAAPGFAAVSAAEQAYDGGFFYVAYPVAQGVPLCGPPLRNAADHVRIAARLCSMPEIWRRGEASGQVFTTAEIVLANGENPVLLPSVSFQPAINIGALLSCPERALAIPPELLRGSASTSESRENYAVGSALMSMLFKQTNTEPSDLLLRVANGTLFDAARRTTRLERWVDRLDGCRDLYLTIESLVLPDAGLRSAVQLSHCAAKFETIGGGLVPLQAVRMLRDAKRPTDALALAQDILLEQENPDVMCEAGCIVGDDLNRPLEAVDYFERAILACPHKAEYYMLQLKAIEKLMTGRMALIVRLLRTMDIGTARLEGRAVRDFHAMPKNLQGEHVEGVAGILLGLERFEAAEHFVWPHLMEGTQYQWWKLPLVLRYIEAKVGRELDDEAEALIAHLKSRLALARQNGTIDRLELDRAGQRLLSLERIVFERKQRNQA